MTSSKLKVVQFASGDLWGGAEAQLYSLSKYLKGFPQVQLTVVLLNDGELYQKLKSDGIEVHLFDESQFSAVQIFSRLNSLLKKINPHLVHTHRDKENIIGSLAAKVNNIHSIRSVHGAPEHIASWSKPHKKLIHWLNRWTGRKLQQRVVSVSHELTDYLLGEFTKDKVVVVENGLDIEALEKFKRSPLSRFKNENVNVGIVGRLVPVKRVDRFLESAQIVLNNLPQQNVIFNVFGDGPLRNQLEEQAANLQLSGNILFHGHCSGSDIHEKIAGLDLLLMTSDHEGLPMTLLESMFLGTPVICSSVGAMPRVLRQGDCGILVEKLSANAFAIAIEKAIENNKQTLEKAQNAIQRVISHYSALQNAKNFLRIYSNVTGFCHPELVDQIEGLS